MARDEPQARGLARFLLQASRWRAFLVPASVLAFVAAAVGIWLVYGQHILPQGSGYFAVELENLHVTPAPTWVKTNVCEDVYQAAGWQQQSLNVLQADAAVRVAQAFEQHTWVAKVSRVRKRPGGVLVIELQYRRPVAMVEVDYRGQGGLLPVDASGVLLPPADFTAEEATTYPRITVDYSGPSGSVGTPWGDERVHNAAAIATLLFERWKGIGLYRIVAVATQQPSTTQATYELHTRGKAKVLWGHAPDQQPPGEALPEQKMMRLVRFVDQHGPLDAKGQADQVIDVRDSQKLTEHPKSTTR